MWNLCFIFIDMNHHLLKSFILIVEQLIYKMQNHDYLFQTKQNVELNIF
jgi:hypothetical protein